MIGSMGSAAVVGFMAGGPIGAAGGAVVGATLWFGGELAGAVVDKWLS